MLPGVGSPLLWAGFAIFVLCMLVLDLRVFNRRAHEVRYREALIWTLVWVSLALLFNAGIYVHFGHQRGLEFLTGYLIEYALSVDNIFIFLVIFQYFSVPSAFQHRVLFWGIIGALVMRLLFILLGAALLRHFEWIIFVLGGFVVLTGVNMLRGRKAKERPDRNLILRLFKKFVPTVSDAFGSKLVVRRNGRLHATPLLLVLVVVEGTDLAFATDSIPAIFAVTRDPFVIYTSNIFAILGLRSLYFLLARAMKDFAYLNWGLGLVLIFVGIKMLVGNYWQIPIGVSAVVVGGLLGGSIAVSHFHKNGTSASPSLSVDETPPLPPQTRK